MLLSSLLKLMAMALESKLSSLLASLLCRILLTMFVFVASHSHQTVDTDLGAGGNEGSLFA
jgi:hypothetical protein